MKDFKDISGLSKAELQAELARVKAKLKELENSGSWLTGYCIKANQDKAKLIVATLQAMESYSGLAIRNM